MRSATRIVAAAFGAIAGLAGLEHGYFEMLHGSTRPEAWMFASMGAPCVPSQAWHACEPAMSLIPNFLITGIVTIVLGLAILLWSLVYVQGTRGGSVLLGLSLALLLLGGGFVPPLIGLIGGAAATLINRPVRGQAPGGLFGLAAKLWPWPLVVFITWIFGQFLIGYLDNGFLQSIIGLGMLLLVVTLPLSVYAAYAHDAQTNAEVPRAGGAVAGLKT